MPRETAIIESETDELIEILRRRLTPEELDKFADFARKAIAQIDGEEMRLINLALELVSEGT